MTDSPSLNRRYLHLCQKLQSDEKRDIKREKAMKKFIRIAIIVVLVIGLITAYSIYKKQKNRPEWRLETASEGTIREEVTASGTLKASTQVEVGTEVSGTIQKLYKDFNDTVKKGELLAKLDTENLQNAVDAARADVNKAEIDVRSTKLDLDLQTELHKKDMGTSYDLQKAQNAYDQALLNLANARVSLKRAEKNLSNAIITSPINGVVISRTVEEGQTVAASMNAPTLFVIANNLKQMQIYADVDEADIGKIRNGLQVEFTVDAFADEQFEGRVKQVRLSSTSTNNVVTYSVIIDVSNPELKLLPGMTANVTIVVQEKENVLRIPETAIRFKPSKELWQQFGLKWDDTFSSRSRMFAQNGSANAASSTNGQYASAGSAPGAAGGAYNLPDSIKQKIANMNQSERRAYFQKLRQQGGFSKGANSKSAPGMARTLQTASQNSGQFNFGESFTEEEPTSHNRIYILKDGKPQALDIVTGLSDGTYVQVISGLTADQKFITGVNYKNAKQSTNNSAFGGGGFGHR